MSLLSDQWSFFIPAVEILRISGREQKLGGQNMFGVWVFVREKHRRGGNYRGRTSAHLWPAWAAAPTLSVDGRFV